MNFSVCIEMIFNDRPLEERIAAVAESGFGALEFWGWRDKDLKAVRDKCDEAGLAIAAIIGARQEIVDESTHQAFLQEIRESAEAARQLRAGAMIVLTGPEITDRPREEQHANIVSALRAAAPIAEQAGVRLALEPLNALVDHKGYYLVSSEEGFEIVAEVDSPEVGLLFDVYHQQVTEGNVTSNLVGGIDRVVHVHVADVPGRHEPGSGELNYMNVLRATQEAGYSGYAGLEFSPTGDHMDVMARLAGQLRDRALM